MNAGKLLEIVRKLLAVEEKYRIQQALEALNAGLANLASNPNDPNLQNSVAEQLTALGLALKSAEGELTPADWKRIDELHGRDFFSSALSERLQNLVRETGMTPAAAQQQTAPLVGKRQDFIATLAATASDLTRLGVSVDPLEPGEAEVGFQLPRDLFENELAGLIDELRVLRRVIRVFSELATGSAEPIEVAEISTTDPTFFFALKAVTVGMIGTAISWALDQWKKIEEIRKLRAETAKLTEAFSPEDIKQMFDDRIEQAIKKAIEEHVNELVPLPAGHAGRKNEQRTDLTWALEAILSRVERGMTVEVRMLPPPEDGPGAEDAHKTYEDIRQVQEQLIFPAPTGKPVLALVHMPKKDGDDPKPKK